TSLQFAAREIARRSSLSVDLWAHKNADQKTVSSNLQWMIRKILVYFNSFEACAPYKVKEGHELFHRLMT
ncbi:hypothetical protein AAZF84_32710, partial [Bacillus sp. JR_15]